MFITSKKSVLQLRKILCSLSTEELDQFKPALNPKSHSKRYSLAVNYSVHLKAGKCYQMHSFLFIEPLNKILTSM